MCTAMILLRNRTLSRILLTLTTIAVCGIWTMAFAPWSSIALNCGPEYPAKPPRPVHPVPAKWVVMSDGNTQPCSQLAEAFGGWRILLVNRESAWNEPHSDCRYLSGRETQTLQRRYGLTDSTTAGVMFAVTHSAEAVYVPASGERIPPPSLVSIPRRDQWLSSSVVAPARLFPSARHFGCNASVVARESGAAPQYSIVRAQAPAMAAVARLVTSSGGEGIKQAAAGVACDAAAPTVMLAPGTYAHITRQPPATVHYAAMWAFSATCQRQATAECALWNFVLQYLLWQTGHTLFLVYDPSGVEESSKPPSPDTKLADLQLFLEKWQCSGNSTLACGKDLINDLAQSTLLSYTFAASQIAWLSALQEAGYAFPTWKKADSVVVTSDVIFHAVDFTEDVPWVQRRNSSFLPVANHARTSKFYDAVCKAVPKHLDPLPPPPQQYPDTLLIIVFNSAYYDNIRHLETLYRSTFPRILYCGPEPLTGHAITRVYNVSFVMYSAKVHRTVDKRNVAGSLNYECLVRAVSMNYRVAGYYVLADDMLLLPQSLRHHNTSAVWYMKHEAQVCDITTLKVCRNGTCSFTDKWVIWERFQNESIDIMTSLRNLPNGSDTLSQCHQRLVSRNGGEMRVSGGNSDTYYVPARLFDRLYEVYEYFLQHQVFTEIAVDTVIDCLTEEEEETWDIPGKLIWGKARNSIWKTANAKSLRGLSYIHATKWSTVKKNKNMRKWFCTNVMSMVLMPDAVNKTKN